MITFVLTQDHFSTASTGTPISTPASAAQPASDHTWRPRILPSEPSMLPSEPPAPKRRKREGAPFAEIKRGFPTEKIVSAVTSPASPVPSETLAGEHRIKRERSLSPELSAVPQVITAGSKRYAPLPPECRKSQPNHKAARNAWAKKEQKALKRLGLRVVRTFIRSVGNHSVPAAFSHVILIGRMGWLSIGNYKRRFAEGHDLSTFLRETTDSEPVEADAVIERALLLNHAGTLNAGEQSFKPTTPSLARIFPDSDQPYVGKERSTPSVVEDASQALEGHGGCESIEESGSSTSVAQISKPYQGGGHPLQPWQTAVKVDAPASVTRQGMSPGNIVHGVPSDHTRRHQTADNAPSSATPPSDWVWKRSTSPNRPSQHHSISPQLPQSPSQRSMDTLQHILHMKRQFVRQSPDLLKPPVASSSPSSSLRKLYPVPTTPQHGSSSRQSPGSSADAVAAAINEGAHLAQRRSTTTPSPSTPLRVYKRRPRSSATPTWRNDGSAGSQTDEEHQVRRSQSSGEHSSPPIAVLVPIESSPVSRKASSSACGDDYEYDELELSYPPSPIPAPPEAPEAHLDPHLPALVVVPPESPPQAQLMGPTVQNSVSDIRPPSPDENTTMQSSALHYFQRYCQTFDKGRRALAGMYATDAFFSCSSRDLRAQGPDDILDALEALGPLVLCSGHSIDYDVTYLGPNIGVLLVVLGTMNSTRDGNGDVRYAMSFVLRPGGEDQERSACFFFIFHVVSPWALLRFFFSWTVDQPGDRDRLWRQCIRWCSGLKEPEDLCPVY